MFTGNSAAVKFGLFFRFPKGMDKQAKREIYKKLRCESYECKTFSSDFDANAHLASLGNVPMRAEEFCMI